MITWPVVIKFEGDNELSYVASQLEWESEESLSGVRYGPADQMIDSVGEVYHLNAYSDGKVLPRDSDTKIELEVVTELVREHASQLGNCCVSKLGFYSIADAVASVDEFE